MAARNNLFIFTATLFAVVVMLNSPKHVNAFWNPSKYPEPVPGYFKVLDRCEKPLATKFPSCSNATMAAIFKKKHIPNKCCPEVTKFSKFCYHALGLFVATTPDFILTVPEFFERTQKVYDHCLRVVQSPSKPRRGRKKITQ